MNKKIFLLFVLIFFLFLGGFFLFSKTGDIFKNNRLLAAIKEFLPFEKSEEPPSPLVLLEQELRQKYELLQKELVDQFDDVSERVDFLNQKVVEIETQVQTLGALISEKETKEKTEIELEKQESEEEKTTEDEEEEEEQEQIICQKLTGGSALKNKVIFNEIAWMGTNASANNEWLELKNISGTPINLTGWQILDKDSNIKIIFKDSDSIPLNGFYLLEKKEEAVESMKADKIYTTGSLNNENESLELFDKNCQLQDEILANPAWPAGDNSSKRTMERKTDLSWQTSQNPGGTPKVENSSGYIVISNGGGSAVAPPPTKPSYPKILISEIQILPTEQRFVELYNPNNQEVNLNGWYIQRKTQSGASWDSFVSSPKFEGKTIPAKGYFLISKQIENSDIVLDLILSDNNSLVLKNPNQEIVDKLGWGQAQEFETAPTENPTSGKSIGRKWNLETQEYQDTDNNSVDFEIQEPTPKLQNQSLIPSPSPTPTPTPTPTPEASPTPTPEPPPPPSNLLLNPGFEDMADWIFGTKASCSTEQARSGSWSAKQVELITSYAREIKSSSIFTTAGKKYILGGWYYLKNPGTDFISEDYTLFLRVQWDGTSTGQTPSSGFKPTAFDTWIYIGFEIIAKPGTTFGNVIITAKREVNKDTDVYWDDMFLIEVKN